jgi:hypothetical protein
MPLPSGGVAFLRFIIETDGMWKIFLLFILYSCSQLSPKNPAHNGVETISLGPVYDHLRSSYLKGCVDAYKSLKVPLAFETCLDKAILHEKEVREIMDQDS